MQGGWHGLLHLQVARAAGSVETTHEQAALAVQLARVQDRRRWDPRRVALVTILEVEAALEVSQE